MREQVFEHFLEDTKNHKIKIVVDDKDNLIKHLKFKGESFNCWFDIITWKGSLCIDGDHGSFVFSRINDMFAFFRSENEDLRINPSYWAEKVKAESIFGEGIKNFSVKRFEENVKQDFYSYFQDTDNSEFIKSELIKKAWEDVKSRLINCEDEYECVTSMREFSSEYIRFDDFWEYSCNEYSFHYLWCLYAIVWGIREYDKIKS